ncbi:hypothetical protein J6590_053993 [Homalodisca vitripennis]|nr:hypothetical protein J6590_053993 [Homalodisca vitripennis]
MSESQDFTKGSKNNQRWMTSKTLVLKTLGYLSDVNVASDPLPNQSPRHKNVRRYDMDITRISGPKKEARPGPPTAAPRMTSPCEHSCHAGVTERRLVLL